MNIFALDIDPLSAAQYHNNKHVVKMITEYTQLLSNWARSVPLHPSKALPLAMPTHEHHPCSLWLINDPTKDNEAARWLSLLLKHLIAEYDFRYQYSPPKKLPLFLPNLSVKFLRARIISNTLNNLWEYNPKWEIEMSFPLAMPGEYRPKSNCPSPIECVNAYRRYYIGEKHHIANWGLRGKPYWHPL